MLTRLAQQDPPAERWLEQALAKDVERLAEPAINVAIQSGDPIGPVLARVLARNGLSDPARLEALLPYPTVALREVAATILEKEWQALSEEPKPWSEETKAEAARIANNLAVRFADLGRREDALAAAAEARDLYRALAAARPDAFTPDLAHALARYSEVLARNGDYDAACEAMSEAIAALRGPFLALPAAFAYLMRPMCHLYLQFGEKLGREPDGELLGPIAAALQRLGQEAEPG